MCVFSPKSSGTLQFVICFPILIGGSGLLYPVVFYIFLRIGMFVD